MKKKYTHPKLEIEMIFADDILSSSPEVEYPEIENEIIIGGDDLFEN